MLLQALLSADCACLTKPDCSSCRSVYLNDGSCKEQGRLSRTCTVESVVAVSWGAVQWRHCRSRIHTVTGWPGKLRHWHALRADAQMLCSFLLCFSMYVCHPIRQLESLASSALPPKAHRRGPTQVGADACVLWQVAIGSCNCHI